jgi:hypothetical protein
MPILTTGAVLADAVTAVGADSAPRKTGHRGDHRLWRSADCGSTGAAAAVGQRLLSASGRHRGFTGGYQSVKRFVRKLVGPSKEACAVIETAVGEEAQASRNGSCSHLFGARQN